MKLRLWITLCVIMCQVGHAQHNRREVGLDELVRAVFSLEELREGAFHLGGLGEDNLTLFRGRQVLDMVDSSRKKLSYFPVVLDERWTVVVMDGNRMFNHNLEYFVHLRSVNRMRNLLMVEIETHTTRKDRSPNLKYFLAELSFYVKDSLKLKEKKFDYNHSVIHRKFHREDLFLFPNPVDRSLVISFERPFNIELEWQLVDQRGSVVRNGFANDKDGGVAITEDIPSGLYYLQLRHDRFEWSPERVVISHERRP